MLTVDKEKCIGCGLCARDCTRDVISLEEGMAVIGGAPCLKCWHCIAICPQKAISSEECREDEVLEYSRESFAVEPEKLLNLIRFRRSIRLYQKKEVERETLLRVIEAGRVSPTGCNRQPLRFLILDRELEAIKLLCMEELKAIAEEAPDSPAIANDTVRQRFLHMAEEYRQTGRDRLFFNAPLAVVLIADTTLGGRPLLDAGIAAANMELMACTQGLGTCYIGFFTSAVEYGKHVAGRIGLREGEIVAACFVTGYPAHSYRRTVGRNPGRIERL